MFSEIDGRLAQSFEGDSRSLQWQIYTAFRYFIPFVALYVRKGNTMLKL